LAFFIVAVGGTFGLSSLTRVGAICKELIHGKSCNEIVTLFFVQSLRAALRCELAPALNRGKVARRKKELVPSLWRESIVGAGIAKKCPLIFYGYRQYYLQPPEIGRKSSAYYDVKDRVRSAIES
jgi:hypothetical protein